MDKTIGQSIIYEHLWILQFGQPFGENTFSENAPPPPNKKLKNMKLLKQPNYSQVDPAEVSCRYLCNPVQGDAKIWIICSNPAQVIDSTLRCREICCYFTCSNVVGENLFAISRDQAPRDEKLLIFTVNLHKGSRSYRYLFQSRTGSGLDISMS